MHLRSSTAMRWRPHALGPKVPNTGIIQKRCAVHHDVLRQLYLPHASDTLMTTTPPSAKGLPVGGLATAVPTWRLCSQRLVNGASEQLLNLLDLRQSFIAPGTSHAVMTNRRGCYRTTEGRPLLQRDPDGHRRRPGLRLEIATGLALPLTLSGTQSHSPSSVRKRPGGHFA